MAEQLMATEEEKKVNWWKDAWQKATAREEAWREKAKAQQSVAHALGVELQAIKAERDRWRSELNNYRRKLADLQVN